MFLKTSLKTSIKVLKKKYFRVCEFSPFYSITQQFSNSLGSEPSSPPRFSPLFSNWLEATVFSIEYRDNRFA